MTMKIFKVKFGEESDGGSYTDDCRIAADSMAEAVQKATQISQRNVKDSNASFEFEKSADGNRDEQKRDWNLNAIKSWEPTSIIYESTLEDVE